MGFYESVARPLLFRLDPETAHGAAMSIIASGLAGAREFQSPLLEQELFGKRFPNPLGLAAGFDKNAVAVPQWRRLGFGFIEVGTVTPRPQPGNPRPRLFRLPADKALINRMGFNSDGAEAVASRLRAARAGIPVGVNLGKTKATPLEQAPEDYRESFRLLRSLGDYFVVNVSSPNTPGLRQLQEKGPLLEILAAIREIDATPPLFVKIAPDLEWDALDEVLEVAREARLTGLIATNTTLGRDGLSADPGEAGGLSGAPLRAKSNSVLRHIAECAPELILVGVGGIMSSDDLYEKIALGAHLAQIYTGWIYGGPGSAAALLVGLAARMAREGAQSLQEIRGSALAASVRGT